MIYLSAQEGALPTKRYSDTLVPYTLRRGFGLPTGRAEEDPGQDYTFFQSIARAERLTFVVAPASDGYNLGEESRYISLLQYIYGCDIKRRSLRLEAKAKESAGISKRKEGELWEQFVYRTDDRPQGGSPTVRPPARSLQVASRSTLLVRYASTTRRSVATAKRIPPSLLLASNEFGTVLHRVMEEFYSDLTKSPSTGDQLTFTTITKEMIDEKLRAKGLHQAACREKPIVTSLKLKPGVPPQRTLAHLLPDDRALCSRAPRVGQCACCILQLRCERERGLCRLHAPQWPDRLSRWYHRPH